MYQPSIFMERMDSKNKILSLNLYRGKEAFELLSNCNFQNAWDNLYKVCPWSTVFQRREFITSWYNTYQEDFQPLIIMEKQSDEITGMVHLAIPIKDAKKNRNIQIIGAGKFDAEYQVWLTEPDNKEFIKEALKLLLKEYPKCKVIFRYIPPTVPLNWLESNSWKNRITIQGSKRPLIGPNHPEFPNLLRKRHLKAKYNRINRAGELKLEDITDSKQFSDLLDFLAIQYDFRQGALFNKN
ncbi:GNAT family N-acetyltransferase [Echinicola shivajiensis]|uniref:hypothetical protein n=1 Tax=Echinicola shivajiensis TaxID=1035916 RepID=UPI001BFC7C9A|nr:hypothetical protein [Echinicola shivajiensis]